ncbi:MAG: M28 family peptidase [Gammaproteobacteria bacterium]|nr:M28 family peptidase [Gammaproteobacteria bacterium]MBU1554447.1 M28 family peptidase [Gammaproteobacteria bacterium]MBU2070203.1 M28 family peptidase [Gammaproteobacteria bacterium]MBU2183546.1 M28 family peptidase [Gammaproteobacteria bacterium]MBU2204697.1 M28 family peptidase [Gammaproteobacteria bacterium]
MTTLSRFTLLASALAAGTMLTACTEQPAATKTTAAPQSAAAQNELTLTEVNPRLGEYIKTLASDEFQGRAPATKGEELTVAYLEDNFRRIGLKPIDGDSYKQPVSLVQIDPVQVSAMTLTGDKLPAQFNYRDDMTAWTTQVTEQVDVVDSEMVFVGYGIVAPEYNWNDYEGLDVKGKTVVMFVNDPGFATQDPALFNGNAMTYYGRWTYKFEEAARQGAAMALIIHETDAASYGWGVVAHGSPIKFDLINENKNMDRAKVEGWVTTESAEKLFANIGTDLASMHKQALQKDFAPIPLNAKASVSVKNNLRELTSSNVVGYIEGSKYPDEYVLYMAHWDHLGMDFSNPNNKVFNGAQDNASGTGGLLALAEYFTQQTPPERSVVFVAVTAEERGLLGSAWYAANPVFPLEKTVVGINMDVMNVYGPMKDMVIVGLGNNNAEDILIKYTKQQGRYAVREHNPQAGIAYRSDHFNLSKKGVPILYAKGGNDHFEHGEEWGKAQRAEYNKCCYHKVGDEWNDNWDLRGAQQDLFLFYQVGNELANSRSWPNWNEGNEFRALRDASAAARKE